MFGVNNSGVSRSLPFKVAGVLLIALGLMASLSFAQSNNASQPVKSEAYEQAFADLMEDPSNPENSFRFAKQAIRSGDLQGGITAFERILKINPGLDNIKLELGILYLRVGASDLAKQYLSEALASPEIPLPVKNRAKTILKQAEKAASPHSYSFRVGLGAQYDDNATSSPTSPEVLVAGNPALLDEASLGESDSALVFSASFQHVYNLNSQIGNQLETSFSYSNRSYDESTEIDSEYLALQIGPRFYFGEILNPSWSMQPFLRVSSLDLDDSKYQDTIDLGLNVSKLFGVTNMTTFRIMYSDNDFSNSARRPTASERTGEDIDLDLRFSKNFRSNIQAYFSLGGNQREAEVTYQERKIWRTAAGLTKSYRAPFGLRQRWNSSVGISYSDISYDAPDPAIDPINEREEERAQFSWNNTLVFNRNYYATASIYYIDNSANIPNYEYDNTGINLTFWASF
jgi:tetratricopeptide (TPR) repeat protein